MDKLIKIINYIAQQGIKAVKENTDNEDIVLDYLAICAKNDQEYQDFLKIVQGLGEEVEKKTNPTGHTFKLKVPIQIPAGTLKYLKIRKFDPTRPQRGAPDFAVKNYEEFKTKYLIGHHNFSLILRTEFEMIELKGVDVLVYFPSKTIEMRLISSSRL